MTPSVEKRLREARKLGFDQSWESDTGRVIERCSACKHKSGIPRHRRGCPNEPKLPLGYRVKSSDGLYVQRIYKEPGDRFDILSRPGDPPGLLAALPEVPKAMSRADAYRLMADWLDAGYLPTLVCVFPATSTKPVPFLSKAAQLAIDRKLARRSGIIPVYYYVAESSELPVFDVFQSPKVLIWRDRTGVTGRSGKLRSIEHEGKWIRQKPPTSDARRATLWTTLTPGANVARQFGRAVKALSKLKVDPLGHLFVWLSVNSWPGQVHWGLAYDERPGEDGTRTWGGLPPEKLQFISADECKKFFPVWMRRVGSR